MLRFVALLFFFTLLSATSTSAVSAEHRHARIHKQSQQSNISPVSDVSPTWSIDVSQPLVPVSTDLFGIFFEELNHAGQGGLYSQSIQNSNFEDATSVYWPWAGIGNVSLSIDKRVPLNGHNPRSLKVTSTGSARQVGVSNPGYWGVNVNVSVYHVTFWARSTTIESITVALTSADRSKTYSTGSVDGLTQQWKKFAVDLSLSPTDDNTALFVFSWQSTGAMDSVYFDVVSALPNEGWLGLPYIRADLADKLLAIHPSFVRFPGGCYVEGFDLVNRFNWKEAVGPFEERRGHWSDIWVYWSDDALGLFEYLSIIERLTDAYGNPTRAVWVVNNGISHYQSLTPEQVVPYVQDALDSLEFAMGPVDSEWGRIRASMGHPAPFPIAYLAIGNEDCPLPYYNENYQLFYEAISAAYPEVKLISNCDPAHAQGQPQQLWDYHFYDNPTNVANANVYFDGPQWRAPGTPKVFNSEYAVTAGAGHGNLLAALAESAWMTGLERNSDVVTMASYAPLFVNNADHHWDPDAIVFDSERSYGTPSYWNQVIWSNSFAGTVNGSVRALTNSLTANLSNVYVAVSSGQSQSQSGGIILIHKLVNIKAEPQPLTIDISGLPANAKLNPTLDVVSISGTDPNAENSFSNSMGISPVYSQLQVGDPSFSVTLPAWSVLIVRAYASTS